MQIQQGSGTAQEGFCGRSSSRSSSRSSTGSSTRYRIFVLPYSQVEKNKAGSIDSHRQSAARQFTKRRVQGRGGRFQERLIIRGYKVKYKYKR
jgi:hypothetical protein